MKKINKNLRKWSSLFVLLFVIGSSQKAHAEIVRATATVDNSVDKSTTTVIGVLTILTPCASDSDQQKTTMTYYDSGRQKVTYSSYRNEYIESLVNAAKEKIDAEGAAYKLYSGCKDTQNFSAYDERMYSWVDDEESDGIVITGDGSTGNGGSSSGNRHMVISGECARTTVITVEGVVTVLPDTPDCALYPETNHFYATGTTYPGKNDETLVLGQWFGNNNGTWTIHYCAPEGDAYMEAKYFPDASPEEGWYYQTEEGYFKCNGRHHHPHAGVPEKGKAATCKEDGWNAYYSCSCGKYFADSECTEEIVNLNEWKSGKGKISRTEEVPKLEQNEVPAANPENNIDSDILALTENYVTGINNDNDMKGSSFGLFCLSQKKAQKNGITLTWKRVPGADGYILYGARCGSNYEKIASTTQTTYSQNELKKGAYYKYFVTAIQNGNTDQTVIAASKTIHIVTAGGKNGNAKAVKVQKFKSSKNAKKVTLKAGKMISIKAKEVKKDKKIKKHVGLRFESSDESVAAVNKNGKIEAISAGKATIYVYAQNGIYSTINVTVK